MGMEASLRSILAAETNQLGCLDSQREMEAPLCNNCNSCARSKCESNLGAYRASLRLATRFAQRSFAGAPALLGWGECNSNLEKFRR